MKTKKFVLSNVCTSLFIFALAGCTASSSDNDEAEVSQANQALAAIGSTETDTAKLGLGYDSTQHKLLFRSCVTGTSILSGNQSSTITLKRNMTFEDVNRTINGSLNVGLNIPIVKAKAGAEIALRHGATTLSETQSIVANYIFPTEMLDPDTIALNANGLKYAGSPDVQSKCGNEFIAEVHRGATLLTTLKVDYLNSNDQTKISGRLMIDFVLGNIEGDFKYVDQKIIDRTTLTIEAEQRGGTPEELSRVIPDNVMKCSLADTAPCQEVLKNVIAYMKDNETGFLGQLKKGSSASGVNPYNVLNYVTQSYADSNADDLVATTPIIVADAVTNQLRITEQDLRAAMEDRLRATKLRQNTGGALDQSQLAIVGSILDKATSNESILFEVSDYCYKNLNTTCLSHAQEQYALLQKYNRSDLEFPDVDLCPGGCTIGNTCVAPGVTESGNSCRKCDPTLSRSSYSSVADGTICDDGLFCTDTSQCSSGSCVTTKVHACSNFEVCDESQDRCFCTSGCVTSDGRCTGPTTWYRDADGDGKGDPNQTTAACKAPSGYVINNEDCCDKDAEVKPGQTNSYVKPNLCGGWDYNCSGKTEYTMMEPSRGCVGNGTCQDASCGKVYQYTKSVYGGTETVSDTVRCR
jgi:hypothetical protein